MKITFVAIIISQVIPFVFLYLTKTKWTNINKFLINKNKYTNEQVDTINKIIYKNYENWAFYTSYQFKKFHFFKCKEIPQYELNLYASLGLNKAIQKYNPNKNVTFSVYAKSYIYGELYNGITELYPINTFAKDERSKSIYNRNNITTISLLIRNDDYMFKTITSQTNMINSKLYKRYEELWNIIFSIDIPLLTKNIIQLKYSFDFNKIRSNKQISILLCCSEENVRQHINKFKNKLKEYNFIVFPLEFT